MLSLTICGAAGRMGIRLVHLIQTDDDVTLAGAVESGNHAQLENDAGAVAGLGAIQVPITTFAGLPKKADAVIDFSHPNGASAAIDYCLSNRIPLVMATTGLEQETVDKMSLAAQLIPIVWAPNMSLAVNLTMKLVEIAAQALRDESVDVEVIERHHRHKGDSPSGTALKFGEIIASQMGQTEHRHGRHGMVGQRPQSEIGYHAVRAGDNPGEHTILFGMMGETIELRVAASNRDCYAAGAIAAAKFVVNQTPGMYGMADVLGL